MLRQPIHDNWTVLAVGNQSEVPADLRGVAISARVPGCVHTDLMRAGKIPDPYRDLNEHQLQWIGHTDWQYRTTFDADSKLFDHERIDLVCDGLDTVARIELNEELVAETFNMHRGYRFDVRPMLKRESNELTITFASPVKYAEKMRDKLGPLPQVNGPAGPFNFIRKMACNFGWDWGPALTTCGIWRGIRVEGWSIMRIASVRPRWSTRVPGAPNALWVEVELERTLPENDEFMVSGDLAFLGQCLDYSAEWAESKAGITDLCFAIPQPQLWWPRQYGNQPLYDLKIETRRGVKNEPFDIWSSRIGLRTIELDTSPDDIGRKFVLKVNGKPIFCKGFNWIPDDCFLDRACEPSRVRHRIQQAVAAGGNMLRVWGGGIYETDEFYNICDEMGVLVWQDFLFACAGYPEEEPFRSEVEAEARYNVARLSHHPSLAIWNGCNENLLGYRDWGWKEQVKGRTWGTGYYFDLLPKIVKELDPGRPYWAASPWSGDLDVDNGVHPNAATHGNKHVWEAWFNEDYSAYRKFEPRFCSEFGFQGPATYSSIAGVVRPEARQFGSKEMRHRQKSDTVCFGHNDGDSRNMSHLLRHFNLPANPSFDDLHYLLSVNQARALTLGVEWFRSRQPTCMGTLYWQLNDCWPGATTWSCIDGDGRPKLLWYATRRFFADQLLTIQPEADGSLHLNAINDTDEPGAGSLLVTRRDFAGKVLAEQEIAMESPPRSVRRQKLDSAVVTPGDPSRELITVGVPTHATWFFAVDKELRYPTPSFDAGFIDGRLTIGANSLLRDVCIFADRLDVEATVSDQMVTLLPGEAFTFAIESKQPLTKDQLITPPVFRCVNPFGLVPSPLEGEG